MPAEASFVDRLTRIRDERGSFLIETMAAAVIVVGALLALGLLFEQAMATSVSTKAREGGVALQREVVEVARGVRYDELRNTSAVGAVQGAQGSGLADSSDPGGWTIRRRGVTYTVSLGVCSVDDPADGIGTHDPDTFCATGPGTTDPAACSNVLALHAQGAAQTALASAAAAAGVTLGDCGLDIDLDGRVDGLVEAEVGVCLLGACPPPPVPTDETPDDYKRVVTLVTWDRGSGRRQALQSSIVPNPGLANAPQVTAVDSTIASVNNGTPLTSGTTLNFTATTDEPAAALSWSADGSPKGSASGSGTSWSFTWDLGTVGGTEPNSGEVLDGPYVIGARAFDEHGSPGHERARTVKLNRRAPYKPTRFAAGRNGSGIDLEWAPSRERDIEWYRVYRYPVLGTRSLVCETKKTTCRHDSPPSSTLVTYRVVAVDYDSAGALREGALSDPVDVPLTNTPPSAPTNLQLTTQDDVTTLTWSASPGDPDLGDSVSYYRVYRDGQLVEDRYDRTGTAQELSFVDSRTNGMQHTYWVVAVDKRLAESAKLGPVTG